MPIIKKNINWLKVSKLGIVCSLFGMMLFGFCLGASYTWSISTWPYSLYFIGIEFALFIFLCFLILQLNTYKTSEPIFFDELKLKSAPFKHLLSGINREISRYEAGSFYYFNRVRFYKYLTIFLGGLSTVVLGLDMSDYLQDGKIFGVTYSVFAKNIALVIGAIITVATSFMTYWNVEKYWLINKTIANKLKALRNDIENDYVLGNFSIKDGEIIENNKEAIKARMEEYKKIMTDFHKYWEGTLAERSTSKGSGEN
ncbi:MAG: SLATT domain-containing protein [Bacteroidia bacterium]